MNLTAGGLFIGLLTGLLGAWLFLQFSERNHTDYRVTESRVACDSARLDAEFDKHDQAAQSRVKSACGNLESRLVQRDADEEKTKKQNEELKKSIEKALSYPDATAKSITDLAASAVSATTSAIKK